MNFITSDNLTKHITSKDQKPSGIFNKKGREAYKKSN